MGGSSKKVTVGYKYYLGMHMVLCHGPADKITKIEVDKRNAWSGSTEGGRVNINSPGLFGGEDREGGVVGAVDIEMGGPAQTKNDYLQARLGTDIPAFRGVVSAVLRQVYLGVNPYLKPWAFKVQRIHQTSSGDPQWYDGAAEILNPGSGSNIQVEDFSAGLSAYTLQAGSWDDFEIVNTDRGKAMLSKSVVGGSTIRRTGLVSSQPQVIKVDFRVDSRGEDDTGRLGFLDDNGNTIFYLISSREQAIDSQRRIYVHSSFISSSSGVAFNHTAVIGDWYTVLVRLDFNAGTYEAKLYKDGQLIDTKSSTTTLSNNVSGLEFSADTNETGYGQTSFSNIIYGEAPSSDMNPAHIIRECLTDTEWGMGYLAADIDDASFTAAADQLFSENMGISLIWDRQMAIQDFVDEIIRHIDASLYVDRVTGKFTLKLIRDDYDPASLITLGPENIQKVSDYSRINPGDSVNSVTVIYHNADTDEDASITSDDVALIQSYGNVVNTTIQYPGFSNPSIAGRAAFRDLRALSFPLLSATIEADRKAASLNIGDAFKFSWPDSHEGEVIMRVNDISFGDGKKNRVKIIASEDVFVLPSTPSISKETDGWVEPGGPAAPAPHSRVIEAPYYELVQILGQTDVDNQVILTPEIGYLQVAATRPVDGISARVWVDDGSGYQDSSSLDFCPSAELLEGVGITETTLKLQNVSDLDQVRVSTHCDIGGELIRIDSIDLVNNELTVGRGILDTIPLEHNAGDAVLFWDEYSVSDNTEYVAGESLDVKILTSSSQNELELADVSASNLVFNERAVRPYRPANLRANGLLEVPDSLYPEYPVTITWVDRNRIQETDGVPLDWTDPGVTIEPGTDYRFEFDCLDENLNILGSSTPVTVSGNTKDVTAAEVNAIDPGTTYIRVKVTAQRDGYDSWTTPSIKFRGPFSEPANLVITYRDPVAPTNIELVTQ